MFRFLLKKLMQMVLLLIGVSFLSFLLVYLSPSDPAEIMLTSQGVPVSAELIAQKRVELGLNDPFFVQYFRWLSQAVVGNLGASFSTGDPVLQLILTYTPYTVTLGFWSLLLTFVISVPIGFYAAYKQNTWIDRFIWYTSFLGNAVPSFIFAVVCIYFFSAQLKWLPVHAVGHPLGLVMPIAILTLTMSSRYIRQVRTVVIHELQQEYVAGARSRGIREWHILTRDVFKHVLPFLCQLTSLSFASLLGGVTIIEAIFSWPGLGQMLVSAASHRDFPVIQGYVLWVTTLVILVNLVADMISTLINPQLRVSLTRHETYHDGHVHEEPEVVDELPHLSEEDYHHEHETL